MIDRELEKRVWERIRGQETEADDVIRLLHLCRLQMEELAYLDRELHRRERITLGLLTGLYELSSGRETDAVRNGVRRGTRQQLLRRCRERCGEMLKLCIRMENHPRYGGLFTDLTRWQRATCARLEQMK